MPDESHAAMAEMPEGWLAFHFFHQGDRDHLLLACVAPLVHQWLTDRWIDRFFFVRYPLGGPHVRLRVHCRPQWADTVRAAARHHGDRFFARVPSIATRSEDEILQVNRSLVAADPNEEDCGVCDNDSVVEFPFRPEVARYGGSARLDVALRYFELSSIGALRFLVAQRRRSRGQRLVASELLLARQASGLAGSHDEWIRLLGYATGSPSNDRDQRIIEQGDRQFDRAPAQHLELVRRALPTTIGVLEDPLEVALGQASAAIETALRDASPETRRRVKASQLHMWSNRIGLENQEEVYVCRLLQRAASDLVANTSISALWQQDTISPPPPHRPDPGALLALAIHRDTHSYPNEASLPTGQSTPSATTMVTGDLES